LIVGDQSEVIRFLADPANWAGAVDRVERIDTHGAIVFLGGERVRKLKRAVRFDYMDFSTPERRRACCEAELRLNRRTAPELYLRVVAVTREADGRLALGGAGEPVDWLVEMRRFDQDTLFDRLVESGRIEPALLEGAADAVAALHALAERRTDRGGAASHRLVIDTNCRELDRAAGKYVEAAKAAALRTRSLAALERLAPLAERRRQDGFVRQCHGDLHLHNICLVDGRPTLFDCIEFNDDFAVIDVLYDLCFLLMDLLHRRRPDLAGIAFNHYLEATADYDGLALLPLYLSMRAAIRAHVSLSMAEVQSEAARAAALRGEARTYLDEALALLDPASAPLLAIGGLSGSGKSTLARAVAPSVGPPPAAVVLRSDTLRKRLFGLAPTARLGPEGYTVEANTRVYAELRARAGRVLAAGHAAIVDAVHARPDERAAVEAVARAAGAEFVGVWLDVPPAVMAARIGERRADASDATVAVLEKQLAYDLGEISWHRLAAGGSLAELTAAVLRLLPGAAKR
jgi:hypothetical protein